MVSNRLPILLVVFPAWLRRARHAWPLLFAAPALAQPVPTAAIGQAGAESAFVLDGSLQALRQSTVAAQIGGNVLTLAVKAGDRVKTGQLLARIDSRAEQAGLLGASAGVTQAEAAFELARSHAERTRELRRTGFVSQAALDDAESQRRAAEAALTQARAGRTQAALASGFSAVSAPFDAVVQTTHIEAGDLAVAGRPIATLYAPGVLRAVVMLPSSRSATARAARDVEVQLPSGAWVSAIRRTELPAADPVSQTVEWRLDLAPAQTATLAPGQAVRVRFSGAPATASAARPTVPAAAVLRRGELTAVYVVVGERFVLRAVRLGAALGDGSHELLAGLNRGERIALDPVRAGLTGAVPAPQ